MPGHTIREVQQAFLNRKPLKTTNLESTEDGRLLSYGHYEIARWVRSCRLHGVKDNLNDGFLDSNGSLHFMVCPLTKAHIIKRNNGPKGSWYSHTTAHHASGISGPNVETSPIPTPRVNPVMRF